VTDSKGDQLAMCASYPARHIHYSGCLLLTVVLQLSMCLV